MTTDTSHVELGATHALWRLAHPGAVLKGGSICAACGGPAGTHYSSAEVMADTFTRYDVFRRPTAPHACDACAWYLDARGKRTGEVHPQFSRLSFVILPHRWFSIERDQIPALLRRWNPGPPYPVWLVLSRVKKKHLALLAKPWMPGELFTAQFEEDTIHISRADLEEMRRHVRLLMLAGIGKEAVKSGQPSSSILRTTDIRAVHAHLRALDPWRPSAALNFAVWIAPSVERRSLAPSVERSSQEAPSGKLPDTRSRRRRASAQGVLPLD